MAFPTDKINYETLTEKIKKAIGKYFVTMPLAGKVTLEVEADNEEHAVDMFYEEFDKLEKGINDPNCDIEWDFYEKLVEGNCVHTYYTKVDVEDVE